MTNNENDENDASHSHGHILNHENDLASRVKECVGNQSVSGFARQCGGMAESTLRNILSGALPRSDHLTAIAVAAGVTVDWLATGKGVKYSKDLKAAIDRLDGAPPGAAGEFPLALEPYRRRLDALHGYLAQIDDDRDRDRIIADFLLRAEETKKIGELEQAVTELRSAINKKNL